MFALGGGSILVLKCVVGDRSCGWCIEAAFAFRCLAVVSLMVAVVSFQFLSWSGRSQLLQPLWEITSGDLNWSCWRRLVHEGAHRRCPPGDIGPLQR